MKMAAKKEALPKGSAKNIRTKDMIARRARLVKARRRMLELGFHLLIAFMAAAATAAWALPAAMAERGYSAVGGEWFLIGAVFLAVLYMEEVVRCEA